MNNTPSTAPILFLIAITAVGCGGEVSPTELDAETPTPGTIRDRVAPPVYRDLDEQFVQRISSIEEGSLLPEPRTMSDAPPSPLALDPCDESSYADAEWVVSEMGSFRFHYFSGTAAGRDIDLIAATRQEAYDDIRDVLGIEASPIIDVYLSPNRVAAGEHGVARGRAFPGADRYEVIYTGDPRAFEAVQYGHELVHVLAHYLLPEGSYQLPFLAEGVAEFLDQSGRDYHETYAEQLNAGAEARSYVASFDENDVWGSNYGRAGSFVQAFVDAHDIQALADLIAVTGVRWRRGCYLHETHGCIDSAESLEALLASATSEVTGTSWEDTQRYWRTTVEDVLSYHTPEIAGLDRREIEDLLRRADVAVNADDAGAYRTTMEGFYCEWAGESGREEIATRMVGEFDSVDTSLIAVYPTAYANFPTAKALVTRTEGRGVRSTFAIWFELFPAGWRTTWMEDWR